METSLHTCLVPPQEAIVQEEFPLSDDEDGETLKGSVSC